jgi:hypothetical protein
VLNHYANYNVAIEFEQKSIDLGAYINGMPPSQKGKRKFYVVRMGNKIKGSPNKIEEQTGWDGQLVTTPPSLNLMHITMQSFKQIVTQYLWQYAIDNEDEEVGKGSGKELSTEEEQQQNIMKIPTMMSQQSKHWSRTSTN